MSGRVIDLSTEDVSWPDPIIVDSNLVIANFQHFFPRQDHHRVDRATTFFRRLLTNSQQGVLTPTAYSEVLHIAVKNVYEQLYRGNRATLRQQYGAQIDGWQDLYKQDPTPLRELAHNLYELRKSLLAYNVVIIEPDDLGFSPGSNSEQPEDRLIERMIRYGLDSSDAMITLEASRLGIEAIVSMDRDMLRAVIDFDIYIWT